MNNQVSEQESPIPDEQAMLLWEQWKYRHSFFWKAFYLLVTTVVIISTLPLIKHSIMEKLGLLSLALPLVGLVLGHYGKQLIEAEYKRLAVVGDRYSTVPWSVGTSKFPPFKTDAGVPIISILIPSIRVGCYLIPTFCFIAILIFQFK